MICAPTPALAQVVTYVLLGSTLIAELTVYGFLLVQLDDLSAITEPDVPTDIEGAGTLTKHLTGVNSWTTAGTTMPRCCGAPY